MYNSLIFYNHFGNGDLFESREFVREIMQSIPAEEYYYAHGKNKRTFADFPNMKWTEVTPEMDARLPFIRTKDSLYINTWIGRDSRYVLPMVGCVLDMNAAMFNETLIKCGHRSLSGNLEDYLPRLDFSFFKVDGIVNFIENNPRKKVLVCNGVVNSMQAENFDFLPILDWVSKYRDDLLFIITSPVNIHRDNIITSDSIIRSEDGYDLNEISYLARFCDTIIGRKSGPFVFAHNKDVWMDGTKKSLSFTYAKHSSHFVRQDYLPLKKFWSPETSVAGVTNKILEVLG